MTVNAWRRGLAYCYVTDDRLGYNSLPSWLEEYVDLLKQYKLSPEIYQPPWKWEIQPEWCPASHTERAYYEYIFTLKIISTTVEGLSSGQEIWCVSTTNNFPNLHILGTILAGDLDIRLVGGFLRMLIIPNEDTNGSQVQKST